MTVLKPPRHIWSGDWWEESDRARQEAEEQAAALREAARRRAEANRPPPPPQPRAFTRRHKIAADRARRRTAHAQRVRGRHARRRRRRRAAPDPLPAVSRPAAQAARGPDARGLDLRARQPGRRLDPHERRLGHRLPDRQRGHASSPTRTSSASNKHVLVRFGARTRPRSTARVVGIDPSSDLAVVDIGTSSGPEGRQAAPARRLARACRWATPPSRSATRSASTARRPRASCPASAATSRRPTASRSTR